MSTAQIPQSRRGEPSAPMSSEIPVKYYLAGDTNRYSEPPTQADTFNSEQSVHPSKIGSNTKEYSDSDYLASAAALTAVSKQTSASEKYSAPSPISVNGKNGSRHTPLTPPMSPTRAAEAQLRSPTKATWPVEKYFTSPRNPPSPPRQEFRTQETESRYHINSNNIAFPKTLRHQQEPDMPSTEAPTKYGFLRRSLTLKRQSPPLPREDLNEPTSTYQTANNISFPKTLRHQQEQQEIQSTEAPTTPTRQGFFRRSLTLRRQPAQAAPKEVLHRTDMEPKYHTESNKIFFPKTLRQPAEPEEPPDTLPTKDVPLRQSDNQTLKSDETTMASAAMHPLFSTKSLRQQYREPQVSEPRSLFRNKSQRTSDIQRRPPSEPLDVLQPSTISKHTGLANKTLRRSKPQHRAEPRPQSPATNYVPTSGKTLRLPTERQEEFESETYTQPSPREGGGSPRRTVTTDVRTTQLPAVTHEHIRPLEHHITTPEYTREIHHHDVYNRILPVKDTEVLPTKHYAPSPTDAEKLVEIQAPAEKHVSARAPAAPISMDMASNTTCTKDISWKTHSGMDNTIPFPSAKQTQTTGTREPLSQASFKEYEEDEERQLVSETSQTLPNGTVRIEYVWRYRPTVKSATHEVTETITRPPRSEWSTSPTMPADDASRYMSTPHPSTRVNVGDLSGTRMGDPTIQKTEATSGTSQQPTYVIGGESSREDKQARFHPSVVSEWGQIKKPDASPSTKRDISDEINVSDYRQQKGQFTETEPVSQRPARPSPSRASPRSSNQRSLLSTITSSVVPEKTMHAETWTPQPPGTYEDSGSEYSSAPSQQPSPLITAQKEEAKSHKHKLSAEFLPGDIWRRHSLVIPAGIVKDGHSLMGSGTLMEGREKEEELSRHRLKSASRAEADRVNALERVSPTHQNKHEMEKLARRKAEEIERQTSLNQDIQNLLAAETSLERENLEASQLQKGEIELEKKADIILAQEDELESEIESSRRRRSGLLREAEAEHQKAQALQGHKQEIQDEPGPKVLQAHRRRRSSLLHEADAEQQRGVGLEQQKEEVLSHMDQLDAKARRDLDTALDEAVFEDKERREEGQVKKFLDDEVKRQRDRENIAPQENNTQEVLWTEVKHKHGKGATKGHGPQKLSAQRPNEFTGHNGPTKPTFVPMKKSSSPPKAPPPQPPGNVDSGPVYSPFPSLGDAQGSSETSNRKHRSWANIAASKPV